MADISVPVGELIYICSPAKCTTECIILHIKIQKCSGIINVDLNELKTNDNIDDT